MNNLNYFLNNSESIFINIKELKLKFAYILLSFILTFITCYHYINQIIYKLTIYLLSNMSSPRFIFTKLTEIFYTYVEISFLCSILICIPFLIFSLWLFFIPGFFIYERIYFNFFVSLVLFFLFFGFFLSYFYILPNILKFFLYFEQYNNYFPLHFEAKLNDYILPICILLFNITLCFQLPSILGLLLFLDIINYSFLIHKRKIFYILFIFMSALIAPPDIYSQIILTFLLILLYEVILFVTFFFRNIFFIS